MKYFLLVNACFACFIQLHAQIAKPGTDTIIDTAGPKNFANLRLVQLPRPNSGSYTYEEAAKRKDEIYNLQPTPKYFGWVNPTSGGAVHINKNNEIEVYQFTTGIYQTTNDTASYFAEAPRDTFIVLKNIKDLKKHVGGFGEGNAASVLITSETDLNRSGVIKKLLEELWNPGIQIYYFSRK